MTKDVIFLVSKFPAFKQKIMAEYENNDEFKSMVEDFYVTAQALEGYHKAMQAHVKNELEYRKVFTDLEDEIKTFLSKSRNG